MMKIDKSGVTIVDKKEEAEVKDAIYVKLADTYHYLSLDGQIGGFSPFNIVVTDNIRRNEESIIKTMEEKGEVGSFFPEKKITFYPFKKDDKGYEIDLKNIGKHFKDILKLNDSYYKTDKMIVDTGHGARNFNKDIIIEKLKWLVNNSKYLKAIYIDIYCS